MFRISVGNICCVVECKYSNQDWVFMVTFFFLIKRFNLIMRSFCHQQHTFENMIVEKHPT